MQEGRWLRSPLVTSALSLGLALGMLPACSEEAGPAPMGAPVAGALDDLGLNPELSRSCTAGQTQSCSLMLGEHEGVISCYEGTSTCSDGRFGPCQNGYTFTLERSEFGQHSTESAGRAGLQTLAFSAPRDCENNPCNSYCREFVEAPPAGLTAAPDLSATPLLLWSEGNVGSYPLAAQALGLQEPCQVAGDCQFNSVCIDPSLGSCSHSVCSTGAALAPGCNRCADAVCAVDPDCCGTQPACQHDPCDPTGVPLDPNCDPCVAAVCAEHPECCDGSGPWDATCVGHIASECAALGQSCDCPPDSEELNGTCYTLQRAGQDANTAAFACNQLGTDWHLTDIESQQENDTAQALVQRAGVSGAWLGGVNVSVDTWMWRHTAANFFVNDASGGALQAPYTFESFAAGEPVLGSVGLGLVMDSSGEWHGEDQSSPLLYVCEGPPSFLNPRLPTFEWGASCAAQVERVCGVDCPDGVPVGMGTCESRLPTELSLNCTGFDLAVGAACQDGGRPQIPVCNHGQSPAPAGLRLSHVPLSELRKATPDLTLGGDCNLNVAIPAGQCVVVDDCPTLTANSALVVNPGGPTQDASECRTDDNWSVYQEPIACRTPLCESGTYDMRQVANAACTVQLQNPLGIDTTQAEVRVQSNIPEPHCNPGEQLWGTSCYLFPSTIDDWQDAQDACERHAPGWTLVALNSPAENAWVRSQTDPLRDVQIGLTDDGDEGNHQWSNGSCRSYLNWDTATLQPNNSPPGSEGCARMMSTLDTWEDTDCFLDENLYVCEGPVLDAQGACNTGERMGPDGNCYLFEPGAASAADASVRCQDHGLGWDLAQIDTIAINDFVTGLIGCTPSWIRGVDLALTGPIVTVGDPFIDELGQWQTAADAVLRASVCRGPRTLTAPQALTRVAARSACTGSDEYFFAGGPVAPEELTLCPDTCTAATALRDNRLRIAIPCAPPTAPVTATTHDERYSAECGDDGGVIWDFFYYDAVTPADSRIEFEIRTAPTAAELDANTIPFVPIAQAHAVPTDTQRCEINPPNCPIDIFTELGAPAQQYKELDLRVKMIPGSNGEGPLLRDWRVRYSCPPSQ